VIGLKIKVSGELREIQTRAANLADLTLPLQLWNKYKRKQVQQIFDESGPGWAPRKSAQMGPLTAEQTQSSEDRIKAKADAVLRIKLQAELRRAQRRHARGKGNESKSAAAIKRRYTVLKAFEAMAAGETPTVDFADQKLVKSVIGLRDRLQRAHVKAHTKPLGRMASSVKSKVEKYSVEIYSSVPWSEVHNAGGTAGHGAKIPQRQFLDVTEADIAVLLMLIEMHISSRG
jgi:phage gpG-like protein